MTSLNTPIPWNSPRRRNPETRLHTAFILFPLSNTCRSWYSGSAWYAIHNTTGCHHAGITMEWLLGGYDMASTLPNMFRQHSPVKDSSNNLLKTWQAHSLQHKFPFWPELPDPFSPTSSIVTWKMAWLENCRTKLWLSEMRSSNNLHFWIWWNGERWCKNCSLYG